MSEHQLKEYVNYALHSFLEFLQNESQEKNYALMKKINYYIEREPIQMVSLEGLSSYLNLTPQYVSKVFKMCIRDRFDGSCRFAVPSCNSLVKFFHRVNHCYYIFHRSHCLNVMYRVKNKPAAF